jgi:hypothetical protein
MSTPDPLVRALIELVIDLTWFIDDTIDDDGESRAAGKQLDAVAGAFDRLTPEQREALITLVHEMASAETGTARREFLESFPEDFGLIDV